MFHQRFILCQRSLPSSEFILLTPDIPKPGLYKLHKPHKLTIESSTQPINSSLPPSKKQQAIWPPKVLMLSGQCRSLLVDPLPPRLIGRWVEVINEIYPPKLNESTLKSYQRDPKGPNRKVGSSSSPTISSGAKLLLNVRGAVHLGCEGPRMQPHHG